MSEAGQAESGAQYADAPALTTAACDRGDVDDRAATFPHAGPHRLGQQERRPQVDVQHAVLFGKLQLGDGLFAKDGRQIALADDTEDPHPHRVPRSGDPDGATDIST